MKLLVEKLQNLQALYLRQMRMLLSAEEMIAIKTPFLTERASDPDLHQAFRGQSEAAEKRADKIREILGSLGKETEPIKCKVVYALFDEAEDLTADAGHESVRDAIVITAGQRVKHYQIAVYGTLRQFAQVLGRVDDAQFLDEAMHEAGNADKRLSGIAERVNIIAKAA